MLRVSRSIVPNVFTLANMFSGFMAVLFALYSRELISAAWMIILAAFLDAMDGKIARITKTSSKFGIEYDSLADLISFGIAPSALIFVLYFSKWSTAGIFLSFFPLLFGSIRLARFNAQLEGFEKSHFKGLPSPMAAICLATYVIFLNAYFPGKVFPNVLLLLTLVVSALMVSTIRYEIFPRLTVRGSNYQRIVFFVVVLLGITLLIFPQTLFFPYIIFYILSGLVRYVIRLGLGLPIK